VSQRQKFHTDDVNQCLPNKSGSYGVPNANLFNLTFLLVEVLCSSANEVQQNSNASSRQDYVYSTNIDYFVIFFISFLFFHFLKLLFSFVLCSLLSFVCYS